jgi:hypothetical protein
MSLSGKTIPVTCESSKGSPSSFLFIGLMRVVVLKGGEIGEKVHSMGKVTRKTKGIPSSSVNREFFLFP